MRVNELGTPVIQTAEDETKMQAFIVKLADNLYGRLPKFVKMFLSKDALTMLLMSAANNIASRV